MSAFNAEEQARLGAAPAPTIIGPATLYLGDCIEVMRGLADNSVDSVVTDPPYGIRFMGKSWDGADIEARTARRRGFTSHAPDAGPNGGHKSIAAEAGKYDLAPAAMRAFQEFSGEWAREALRVLKPGGHLLAFSSARTYHRMTSGIEDAGFEIRDQIMWIFGSGFPKAEIWTAAKAAKGQAESEKMLAAGFEGWARGGLKPAHEPICVARKPLVASVAANVLLHGVGALNIDACRVDSHSTLRHVTRVMSSRGAAGGAFANQDHRYADRSSSYPTGSAGGRFPANLIHDGSDEVLAAFPDAAGQQGRISGGEPTANGFSGAVQYGGMLGRIASAEPRVEVSTSAARFYYCAKASRTDRNEGCASSSAPAVTTDATMRDCETADWGSRNGNFHPTVKPTDLMAYLCRLVTPAGGLVLDPFMGSGSTGKAAVREGFRLIGIELSEEYSAIARARVAFEIDAVAQRADVAAEQLRVESLQSTIFELDGI